jgi:hypothetical protein
MYGAMETPRPVCILSHLDQGNVLVLYLMKQSEVFNDTRSC